jgi:hypothetical protein
MDETLRTMLKYLRLGHLLAHWDELLAEAVRGRFSHERLLKRVLEAEYRAKSDNARLLRRKRANIPEPWEIETYPFDRQPNLNRKRLMALYDSFDYMSKKQNVIWMGKPGCGKTGLATSFLLQAIDRNHPHVQHEELPGPARQDGPGRRRRRRSAYPVKDKDKPRRLLADFLREYFFKTTDGTWRPAADEDERQQKATLREAGTLRRMKRFANNLGAGPSQVRPSRWHRGE